jgi:hypothetical protein
MPHDVEVRPEEDVDLLRAVLDREPFAVALLSIPDMVFEYVNPAFQAAAPEQSVTGRAGSEVFPEMTFLAPPLLDRISGGGVWQEENAAHTIRRSAGGPTETVFVTFEASRLDVGGRPHLLLTAQDTTEAVRLAGENARLQAERLRRLELAEKLAEVYATIHSSLDYDEVMQRALEEGTKALGANAGAVFVRLSEEESEARYIYGFPRSLLGRRFPAAMFPFAEIMQQGSEPIPIDADHLGELMNPTIARLFRVRSLIAIPVIIRGELSGGIGLVYRQPHTFVQTEVDFARSLGGSVSLALENAELYRKQERVSDTLQRALLTLPEAIPGLSFAHAYHSATEAVQVGGDFYDLFELEHEIVGLTLGDISGKGLDAAVLTSLVKNAIRVQATEKRFEPADVIRAVNTVVFNASAPEEFATVFLGVLECSTGRMLYCNAGHTTSALVCREGTVERLGSNSSLVGAFRRSSFSQSETRLHAGDMLFLYSDGLIEARSGAEQFGEDRLFALFEDHPAHPQQAVDRAMGAVLRFTGGALTDDVAVLAVKRL